MTRVSERLRYDSTSGRINTARELADNAQQTVLSGRKLRKISDDPVGMGRALKNRARIENIGQFRKTLDFAKGFLAKTEESLSSLNEVLIRAKELAVQQANGSYDAQSRKAASEEVKQLVESAVGLGNSSYGSRFVFGGFQTSQPPLSPDGTFMGDDGVVFVQVDEDSFRPASLSGRYVFDVEPQNAGKETPLIIGLKNFYNSLRDNDIEGIHRAIEDVESGIIKVSSAMAVVGARRNTIDDVDQRLDFSEERLTEENNKLESADPVKAVMDMKRAETALQSTITAGGKILTPTLLDFLK